MSGMFRTGSRVYTTRPPASCRSAREAWDYHAEKGPIVRLFLLDGYWGAEREDGRIEEVENTFAAERERAAIDGVPASDGETLPRHSTTEAPTDPTHGPAR